MANLPDARKRILQSATKVFAEKSFEGSRIEEISKVANVPKSLIYYHFKNKEEILNVLMENFLAELASLLHDVKTHTHSDKAENIAYRLEDHYYNFAIENTELIRIILIESLKKSTEVPEVFKIIKLFIENDSQLIKNDSDYHENERLVSEFFTVIMPIFSYLCFRDRWCDYFAMDKEDLHNLCLKSISEAHGAYHKSKIKE